MIIDRTNKLGALLQNKELDAIFVSNESNVRYLSGYTNHEAYLLVTVGGGRILITDFRYDEIAHTDCPDYEISIFRKGESDLFHTLAAACQRTGVQRLGFEAEHLSVAMLEKIKKVLPQMEIKPADGLTEQMRYIKDAEEEACLRKACAATDRVFSRLCQYIKPGITEKQLEWQLLTFINEEGCDNSFPPIVVSGIRGSLPHGVANDKVIVNGEFITMDFGCMYKGYHADITRTVFVGQPDGKQREFYNTVLEAHLRAAKAIRAGVKGCIPDAAARDYITAKGYGENFGHGLGHGVGLDIHENLFMNASCDMIMEEGCFLTIEPGIYIPGWGGVRIEDTVKVTATGGESLFTSTKELICL